MTNIGAGFIDIYDDNNNPIHVGDELKSVKKNYTGIVTEAEDNNGDLYHFLLQTTDSGKQIKHDLNEGRGFVKVTDEYTVLSSPEIFKRMDIVVINNKDFKTIENLLIQCFLFWENIMQFEQDGYKIYVSDKELDGIEISVI